jgi:preprotein translocase subunit YajC
MHSSPLFAAQPTTIPGEQGSNPAPTTASTAAPEGGGQAGGGGLAGCMGGQGMMFLILIPMMAFLFISSRNANKKQKALESGIKVGDQVITKAGMAGKVVEVSERFLKLELAPGVAVKFLKTSIEGIDTGDPKKEEAKKDEAKKDDAKDAKKDDGKKDDSKDIEKKEARA